MTDQTVNLTREIFQNRLSAPKRHDEPSWALVENKLNGTVVGSGEV